MKDGAMAKIREQLSPEVIIENCHDQRIGDEDLIVGLVKQIYHFSYQKGIPPMNWVKAINFLADQEGNVFFTDGLF